MLVFWILLLALAVVGVIYLGGVPISINESLKTVAENDRSWWSWRRAGQGPGRDRRPRGD
jgi:hypothetical protein